MSKDELMHPRYKVIADYPKNPFKVGEILIEEYMGATVNPFFQIGRFGFPNVPHIYYPEKYPALFKKLFWWEDRKPEDMPEYVKQIHTGVITKTSWTKSIYFFGNNVPTPFNSVVYLMPATEQEYNEYKSAL